MELTSSAEDSTIIYDITLHVYTVQWNPSYQDTSPTIFLTLFVAPNTTFVCFTTPEIRTPL